jgi:hypothetical protein
MDFSRRGFFGMLAGTVLGKIVGPRLIAEPTTKLWEAARFAPKAKVDDLSDWTCTVETGPTYECPPLRRPELAYFTELPERITGLHVRSNRLFAFTETGMFEVFADGSYRKL